MVLFTESSLKLIIPALDGEIQIPFEVVHSYQNKLGLRFLHTTESKKKLKAMINSLVATGAAPRTPIPPWAESLKEWWRTLITTGKGLLP